MTKTKKGSLGSLLLTERKQQKKQNPIKFLVDVLVEKTKPRKVTIKVTTR